jgi:mRNA-degrading endonuclease RelE of RelBE toxin-antitoxin system
MSDSSEKTAKPSEPALPGVPLARPRLYPKSAPSRPSYRVRAKNKRVEEDWDRLAESMPDELTKCWDFISSTPLRDIGDRCHELEGPKAAGTWQYKLTSGHKYRVWYRVTSGEVCVLVIQVFDDHPTKYPGGKSSS